MPEAAPTFRRARAGDVPDIVRMLADDPLGATRERDESPLPESYARAFRAIEQDANNELVVACRGERVVGVLQLTYIPSLARPDARRFYEALGCVASHEGMKLHLKTG